MQWPSEYRIRKRFQSKFLGRTGKHFLIDYAGRMVIEKEELRVAQIFYFEWLQNDHALEAEITLKRVGLSLLSLKCL